MRGGLCCFLNQRWGNNNSVKFKWIICIPDIELVSMYCRPFYQPCEISTIFAVLVDMPPNANYTVAADTITQCIHEHNNVSPGAPKLLLGDVKGCS